LISVRRASPYCSDRDELFANDLREAFRTREDIGEVDDRGQQFLVFGDDLVLLEAREPVQAHVEDGLGLRLGEFVAPARARNSELGRKTLGARRDFARTREQLRDHAGIPFTRSQRRLRFDRRR